MVPWTLSVRRRKTPPTQMAATASTLHATAAAAPDSRMRLPATVSRMPKVE